MRELRAVALSEDGGYLVLADANGRSDAEQFRVPVDDRLRSALRGARRSEVRTESALTPREIQARLRAGETAADVARAAGIPVERVERYEGPVLAERARVVQEARAALLPKDPGGAPGRPLGEVVDARLLAGQDDPEAAQWDAWRRVDGIWLVQLTSESRCARWTWDPVVRRVRPHDDAARALVAPDPADGQAAGLAPAANAPAAARQSPPALALVPDPMRERAPVEPRPATAPATEARPRYAQPAPFPAAEYPEAQGPAAEHPPYPAMPYPAAPYPPAAFPAAPAPPERLYPAAHQPAARYPSAGYPAEHQPPQDGAGPVTGAPGGPYQDPLGYPQPPRPDRYAGPAGGTVGFADPAGTPPPVRQEPRGGYPSERPAPAGYPPVPAHDAEDRPFAPFPGDPYAAEPTGAHPFGREPFDEPFPTGPFETGVGRAEPAGPAGPPPAAGPFRFPAPEHPAAGARFGQPPADDLDLGVPFAPPAGRPPRPAATHRPARPPALDPRPTRPLEGRRWPERDDTDLDLGMDADLFDEPADHLSPPRPAVPRPATAPPRAATAPPRPVPP
ncbi:septation protein SepH, partial [Frankia nepalensis]